MAYGSVKRNVWHNLYQGVKKPRNCGVRWLSVDQLHDHSRQKKDGAEDKCQVGMDFLGINVSG